MNVGVEMNVREATRDDAAVIADCQQRMALETEDLELDAAVVQRGVDAVFNDPNKGTYYVATDPAGNVLGCLLTIPEWSDWRARVVLWIHSVYVRPEARGRGVYRQMYSTLQQHVRQQAGVLAGLRLFVDKRNTRAQAVYEQLGMDGEHYALYEWLNPGD